MTITTFLMLLSMWSIVTGFLTQGIKEWYRSAGKPYSANMLALINAAVVGCGGTTISYILMNIPFTAANIACIVLMTGATWLGSMIGYDKVTQLIAQITALKK